VVLPSSVLAQAGTSRASSPDRVATTDTAPAVRLDTTLDLETVIRRALEVSPAATAADQSVRAAESEGRVALGEYVPALSANSSMLNSNISSAPPGSGVPPSAYGASLAASVDLFTGGRRGADRARAASDLGAARATQIAQRFSVTFAAQNAFYGTLRAADLVEVARAGVAQAQQGLRYANDRVHAGTATRSDKLRAELQLTASRQQLIAALDTLQTSAFLLGRIVGANGPVGAAPPSSLDPRPLALTDSEIVRLAIDRSPLVQSARATESAQQASTRAARSQYLPDLKVTSAYNWANQSLIVGSARPGWNVLIGTSYPLFNGFQREDEVTRADASAEVARVTTQDVVRQARTDAARLLSGLRFAEESISLAREGVQSADEDLRVQTERYRAGISTELDQLTSQTAYTQAQIGLVAARYHYQLTRAELEALVGRAL